MRGRLLRYKEEATMKTKAKSIRAMAIYIFKGACSLLVLVLVQVKIFKDGMVCAVP